MPATTRQKTGRYRSLGHTGPIDLRPTDLNKLKRYLEPDANIALPIRPQGAGTASTDCNRCINGSILHTTGLDRITKIDSYKHTVTAQAGVRIGTLVDELAKQGLELIGAYDLQGRTLGGAIAAPCFGPVIGNQGAYFSSHVIAMKIVTSSGKFLNVEPHQNNLLSAFRQSLGLLGVIYEATVRVRPIRTFSASHRCLSIEKFASVVDNLANGDIGFKFYLLPHRDRIFLDLRRYDAEPGNAFRVPWKIKDWGESTVLPNVVRSLNRIVPFASVRYRMIDTISEATQGIVNTQLVTSGTNAAAQSQPHRKMSKSTSNFSTWCFPAANFSMIAMAYRDFCTSLYDQSGFRCDMPAIGYRLCQDASSLLSPSFDEPMIALTAASTQHSGWDDFVIDFADFAEHWAGTPILSQSRALHGEYTQHVYANRLDFFSRIRRRLDPENRLLSPFLAQFVL